MAESWSAVVPVRPCLLAPAVLRACDEERSDLARAMALDVLGAVAATPSISHAVVVTADLRAAFVARRLGFDVLVDRPLLSTDPVNDAVRLGVSWIEGRYLTGRVVVVPADLPALTPRALDRLVLTAPDGDCFVPDARGRGATVLTSRSPRHLDPQFRSGSALAHARRGVRARTDVDPRLRHDVDTAEDLVLAARLDLAPLTRDLLDQWRDVRSKREVTA